MNDIEADKRTEREVLIALRQEVREFKDCFTKFSFQGIAFATAGLGLMLKFPDHPFISLSSVALVALLLGVARIGTFKYESANRLTGFELHLSRTLYTVDNKDGWQPWMRNLGFQEANRAWRLIQPNIFNYFYQTSWIFPPKLRLTHRNVDKQLFWFDVDRLVESSGMPKVHYKPGTYLKVMLMLLYAIASLAVVPILMAAARLWKQSIWLSLIFCSIAVLLIATIVWRYFKDDTQRHLLESKLLSIHSCAVLWQAVIVAHYKAIETLNDVGWRGYTRNLAIEAERLRDNAFQIDEYIEGKIDEHT